MANTLSRSASEPFRQRLLTLRRQLTSENPQEEFRDVSETAHATSDDVDASAASEMSEILGMLCQNREQVLRQIDEALARISDGTYGACVECEKKIQKSRLDTLPHAPHCIACQRRIEEGRAGVRENIAELMDDDDE